METGFFSKKNCEILIIFLLKERDDLLINSTDDLQRQFDKQKLENEQQKLEIERLREALLERDAIIEEQDKRLLIEHETQAIQTVFLIEILII